MGDDVGSLSIMVTLWGNLANDDRIQVGTVIAIKGAKVSDYGGKSLNVSTEACVVEFDPAE